MSIPAASTIVPLPKPQEQLGFVHTSGDAEGRMNDIAHQFLRALRDYVSGTARIIPCEAEQSPNLITLTPASSAPPISGYFDYDVYIFTAAATSTGVVTLTVVPLVGTLATLKAYKTNGAAQATVGDVVLDSVYMAIYANHLDGAAGGFVLK